MCNCKPIVINNLVLYNFIEYSGAYSQLAFAGKKENDPVQGDMQSAKLNLVKQLKMMSDNYPGQVYV